MNIKGPNQIRISCEPFPGSKADIGVLTCVASQLAKRSYCQECKTGQKVFKDYPGFVEMLKQKRKPVVVTHPPYQAAARGQIADSIASDKARAKGGR